ncbi:MAG: site-specific integrase [Deltaproteobacteria bacterium]|nr:site-specific integrase [Deltaproteobacteria bacterium]
MDELNPKIILAELLRPIEDAGFNETAHQVQSIIGRILRYAVACGYCERDSTQDLKGALAPVVVKHRPTIVDKTKIGRLITDIHSYQGSVSVTFALRVLPYVFVRPGELRHAQWHEIDLEAALWTIPAEKMKMRSRHLVPLSTQVVSILTELKKNTGPDGFLFPGARTKCKPISDVAINAALGYLGYARDEICGHGFRAMASTLLNEMGFASDWIERQLAHCERNNVRAAYNHAEYLPERRKMMQQWADFLDSLRA